MLVLCDGSLVGTVGGGGMERVLVGEALEALRSGRAGVVRFALGVPPREGFLAVDSRCGGEVEVLVDPVRPDPRLVILGSGLIAQATSRVAQLCGFQVTVVDDAPTATQENFPGATLVNGPYPQSLEGVEVRPGDYVAVLHGETDFELEALRFALRARPAFIGLLGSANKRRSHLEQLASEGFPRGELERVYGPIGLEIGAETAEEIAVSIVAQLIRVRRGLEPSP